MVNDLIGEVNFTYQLDSSREFYPARIDHLNKTINVRIKMENGMTLYFPLEEGVIKTDDILKTIQMTLDVDESIRLNLERIN